VANSDGLLRRIGRALEPLFDADAEHRRRRDAKLLDLVAEHERTQRTLQRDAERQRDEMTRLRRHLESVESAHLPQLRDAIKQVRSTLNRQERILKRSRVADLQNVEQQRVLARLDRLARSGRPILVGPWTGEVGFELLYWIPFIRWAIDQYRIDPSRIVVLSRGGPRDWYHGLCHGYLDALDLVSVDEFRARTSERKKQRLLAQFDRQLIRRARATLGQGAMELLHPGMMYALFMPYWKRQAPLQRVLEHAAFATLGSRRAAPAATLPADYIAVRFYFSACFPDTPTNRSFAAQTIAALSEHHDVVLLDPGLHIDDHRDAPVAGGPARGRVHVLPGVASPSRNLEVQTEVIRGARAFIGTYGGYAYLAPFYGVDAVAFYSERNYSVHHLEVAQHALGRVGGGALEVVDVGAIPLLSAILRPLQLAADGRH
jgi:hypothetical protein